LETADGLALESDIGIRAISFLLPGVALEGVLAGGTQASRAWTLHVKKPSGTLGDHRSRGRALMVVKPVIRGA
jgi:hypothetical protein